MSKVDHVQAKYWNGFITRTEAQKVFDEQGQVIMQQAMAIQKLDAVLSYMAEKFGVSHEDINNWMKAKSEAVQKAAAASVPDATGDSVAQEPNTDKVVMEPSPIILTD